MNNDILFAWIYPEGALSPVLCGALELLGGRRCIFQYDDAWLAHPDRFSLSADMPLHPGAIEPPPGLDLHPIFEDAGPDRWGKNIINKVFNPRRRSPLEYLELAGEGRIGALGFSRSNNEYIVASEQAFQTADLPDLMRAANTLSAQLPIDEDLRRLLRPGASAGGARPKAIITHENASWIAKFPSLEDEVDVCAIEHASLRLAERCGIDAAETQLVKIGNNNVLLVKRFDREHSFRVHLASARTMLIAEGIADSEMGYPDLADVARRLSQEPGKDCKELFRRMLLNVLFENTDDHDKNHAFLFKHGAWQLSPAYDFQPQLQAIGYQQLRVGRDGYAPTVANVLSEANRFLLRSDEAAEIVNKAIDVSQDWQSIFRQEGVSQADIDICARYVLQPIMFE